MNNEEKAKERFELSRDNRRINMGIWEILNALYYQNKEIIKLLKKKK